jgi:hypothetical protein
MAVDLFVTAVLSVYVQQKLHSHVLCLCVDSRVNATVAITLFIHETAVNSCLFVKQLPVLLERTMNSKALQCGGAKQSRFCCPKTFLQM